VKNLILYFIFRNLGKGNLVCRFFFKLHPYSQKLSDYYLHLTQNEEEEFSLGEWCKQSVFKKSVWSESLFTCRLQLKMWNPQCDLMNIVLQCAAVVLNFYSTVRLKDNFFKFVLFPSTTLPRNCLFVFHCFCVSFLMYLQYSFREDNKVLAMKASETEPSQTWQ